jgi:hypothetical protein
MEWQGCLKGRNAKGTVGNAGMGWTQGEGRMRSESQVRNGKRGGVVQARTTGDGGRCSGTDTKGSGTLTDREVKYLPVFDFHFASEATFFVVFLLSLVPSTDTLNIQHMHVASLIALMSQGKVREDHRRSTTNFFRAPVNKRLTFTVELGRTPS